MEKEELSTQNIAVSRNRQLFKTGILFLGLVILFDYVIWYFGQKEYLAFLDIFNAIVITKLIHLSGLEAIRESNLIYLANTTWLVAVECTAIFLMAIYTSFILAFPSTVRAKGVGLLAGIPFIFTVNIVRLFIMAWIDKLKPEYSEYFHNYAWQVFFILMIILMWIIWIEKIAMSKYRRDQDKTAAG